MLIDCRYSDSLDEKFIGDFIKVENEVFNTNYSREAFNRKYLKNIYGNSVLVVVYNDNNKPIAARALWRNDISGQLAFQPGDTCVLKEARGGGVFSQMTKQAISILPDKALIYNFPNQNSYPGYIKMGWRCVRENRLVLFTSYKNFKALNPLMMDKAYFEWWIRGRDSIKYIKRSGRYFLIRKHSRPLCWQILSEVDKDIATQFSKLRKPALIFYSGIKRTFYNKWFATAHVVAKTDKDVVIPVWKTDAL